MPQSPLHLVGVCQGESKACWKEQHILKQTPTTGLAHSLGHPIHIVGLPCMPQLILKPRLLQGCKQEKYAAVRLEGKCSAQARSQAAPSPGLQPGRQHRRCGARTTIMQEANCHTACWAVMCDTGTPGSPSELVTPHTAVARRTKAALCMPRWHTSQFAPQLLETNHASLETAAALHRLTNVARCLALGPLLFQQPVHVGSCA